MDFTLERPIVDVFYQAGAERILAHVVPFVFVAFPRAKQMVKELWLPQRHVDAMSSMSVLSRPLLPLANECGKRAGVVVAGLSEAGSVGNIFSNAAGVTDLVVLHK